MCDIQVVFRVTEQNMQQ